MLADNIEKMCRKNYMKSTEYIFSTIQFADCIPALNV